MTRHARFTAAVAATALTLVGVAAAAQQNQQSSRQEMQDQGDMAPITIKRSDTWGFSNEVREYLSGAYEAMYEDPERAIEKLNIAVNLSNILAAAAQDGPGKQQLEEAAADLSRFAQRVQNRQIANPDKLGEPSAKVTLAIAQVQFDDARRGLERGEESAVAYSLDSAAANLLQAHVYLKKDPPEQVAKAAYNAARLGKQLKSLIEPTTQQGGSYAVTVPEEKSDTEGSTILDNAQVAGGRQGGQTQQGDAEKSVAGQIPQVTPQVLDELGRAIEQSAQAVRGGGGDN